MSETITKVTENSNEEQNRFVLKLFKGVILPKDNLDVRTAMNYFYKAKNENMNTCFMEVINRIKQLTHTISDLNLPLLLNPTIEAKDWDAILYLNKMTESVDNVIESIKTDIPYGSVENFIKYYQLSGDWLLHGVYTGEEVDNTVLDDDVIMLGKLTGDIESNLKRAMSGSVEHLNHQHKPVHLPSLDTVNQELGDMAEEAQLEDHIEQLVQYKTEYGEQQPVLPNKPNPSGITNNTYVIKSHNSGQTLPKSKLERALESQGWSSSPDKDNIENISLEKLIEEISNRLSIGVTITITGK